MESKLKELYQLFVENTNQYHAEQTKFISPEEMYLQCEDRLLLLDNLNDVLFKFTHKMGEILTAIELYRKDRKAKGINDDFGFFNEIIAGLSSLAAERELIFQWQFELGLQKENMEEINFRELAPEGIPESK